jgi:iron complex transport system substrate-binding protein
MRAALSLLIPVAVVLSGCGSKAQLIGGQPRRATPPAVVSLSPSTSEIVGTCFDARQLVGRTSSDNYPSQIVGTTVVADVKPDFEKIKSIGPGIVLYDGDLYNDADIKRLESMNIPTVAIKAKTIVDFEKELLGLTETLGSETNCSSYVDRIEVQRSSAAGNKFTNPPKIAVVLGGGSSSLYVAGTGSFVADVVKTVGGIPVGPSADKFAQMSSEALVAAAPDIIVLATSKERGDQDFAALKSDARLRTLPAIVAGKVIPMNQDVVVRRGGRVDTFIKEMSHKVSLVVQK